MRVRAALSASLLLAAVACGRGSAEPAPRSASNPVARPPAAPVVVTVVVDQFAAWVASERLPELPADGGFARLRREGTWVRALRYEHAVTDTAPGHSALYTGTTPSVSGIFANEVIVGAARPVSILFDPLTRLLNADGEAGRPSSSLARLQVETVADRLRAEHPDATILSFSLKDRGALFGAGRTPTAALWLDVQSDRFVTSSAVATAFPPWAGGPTTSLLRGAQASTWELKDRAWVERHALTPDAESGEGELPGFGIVFPHALGAVERPALAFRTSPFADEVLLSLGLTALDAEHAGEHPTLLALSLSANDYIGHTFGPDSWEAWDEVLRLDGALGRFFQALDARFGERGYAVLLAADHGTTPMPEAGRHAYCDTSSSDPWQRACGPAHRILPDALAKDLATRIEKSFGPGDWIAGVSDPYVYLTAAARALDPARRQALDAALLAALLAVPGIATIYDPRTFPKPCPGVSDESVDALVCRSVAPGAGDLYLVLQPGSFFDPTIIVGKGTSHGSPYRYDRTVPLLGRAPGRIPAGQVVENAPFNVFAATAAALLGIKPPNAAIPAPSLTAR